MKLTVLFATLIYFAAPFAVAASTIEVDAEILVNHAQTEKLKGVINLANIDALEGETCRETYDGFFYRTFRPTAVQKLKFGTQEYELTEMEVEFDSDSCHLSRATELRIDYKHTQFSHATFKLVWNALAQKAEGLISGLSRDGMNLKETRFHPVLE